MSLGSFPVRYVSFFVWVKMWKWSTNPRGCWSYVICFKAIKYTKNSRWPCDCLFSCILSLCLGWMLVDVVSCFVIFSQGSLFRFQCVFSLWNICDCVKGYFDTLKTGDHINPPNPQTMTWMRYLTISPPTKKSSKIENAHTTPLYVFGFLLQAMPLHWQPAIRVFFHRFCYT